MYGFRGPVGVPGWPVSPSVHLVPPGKEADGPVNAPTATSPAVATQRGKGRCRPRARSPLALSLRLALHIRSVRGHLPPLHSRLTRGYLRTEPAPCCSPELLWLQSFWFPWTLWLAWHRQNPGWVRETRGNLPKWPFLLDRFRLPPPLHPSTSCPSGKPASSQLQEVRLLWGQVQGQQDPELSGSLF